MNQAMHGDDPAFYKIPEDGNLISQYLLLYSMSGEPGDFDTYVDYNYRMANMTVFSESRQQCTHRSVGAKNSRHCGRAIG